MKKLEGNSKENAKITLEVLSGEKSVYRDTVVLNAGLNFRKWKNGND